MEKITLWPNASRFEGAVDCHRAKLNMTVFSASNASESSELEQVLLNNLQRQEEHVEWPDEAEDEEVEAEILNLENEMRNWAGVLRAFTTALRNGELQIPQEARDLFK